ncbi:hypothetical protein VOLCADRAFT_85850 [Volvox carteri f. nagariensis]|uniref:ABC transporter domain-containing protein n=1 Tax=Volvox carteri f. nagariensis TaxID=3068 RepID=D8TH57_VOLCA|nr:uncharacterized protein VOLCADRAFT_85850 [Volvox carteri f. nagariensis]EFJ52653.1 hypothetical protein VOLCADRAFT_85850 [Volvox carteri f. nagariensis]|eukprot:XP_002945658.1 hypothetical protein VOLCADRAFT_85850 [Volvox carteri f. nagariensis]
MGALGSFWEAVLDFLFSFRPIQQFLVLYKKNALVAWRNRRATILRILAPLLFLILALVIDKAIQANDGSSSAFQDVASPQPEGIGSIPQCSQDLYIGSKAGCVEVLYQPSPDPIVDLIMQGVQEKNSNPIKVRGFSNRSAIQDYLFKNPDSALSAVHFEKTGSALEGFIIQTNTTSKFFKGKFQHPNKFIQLPLQFAVHREIARYQLGSSGLPNAGTLATSLEFEANLKEFAHPAIAAVSVLGQVLGPFVFAACMFSFVIQIGVVVAEKELGLKQALRTMGMSDSAYWLSWGVWEVTLSFFVAHSICIYGLILQFDLFLHNNYGLLFFLFFLFQLSMSSMAMMLSAFIRRTQVAVYLGFTIFIVGWIMQAVVLFGVPYSPDYFWTANQAITIIFSMLPWDLLAKGFSDLGAATVGTNPGLKWSERSSYCSYIKNVEDQPSYNRATTYKSFDCVISLNTIYGVFLALWAGYFLLAVYFDNIMPNEFGVSKPFYYFLDPGYWFPSCSRAQNKLKLVQQSLNGAAGHHGARAGGGPVPPPVSELDEDVSAEEQKMKALLQHRTGAGPGAMALQEVGTAGVDGRTNAVEVYGLTKLYKGSIGFCGMSLKCCSCCDCCSCEKTDDFWAMKGSWFSIPQGQLFCLLGPNGAGKTTTINCLTGAIPPTGGEALVYEEPISNPGGLDRIRAQMGVCPQFDILWNELNGQEHLSIYAHIKGLPRRKVAENVAELLEKVKLTYAADQRAGAYSGGMKRRLSVAIALLGDPRIVYLDEPTTGMDPISRRYVWDIIQEAKTGRAIVLTTHSMEEADILGDRIAIMARGKLRCIGTSLRLKQRFGSGYTLSVSVTAATAGVRRGSNTTVGSAAATAPTREPSATAVVERRAAVVKQFFQERLGLAPVDESKAYMHFLVDREKEPLLNSFLVELEANRGSLGITDVQLSLTSLEEVFLNIARKAEMEAATAAGKSSVTHVMDDGSKLQIPIGAELVANPVTKVTYKVRWGTDEAGRLVILDATAVPPPTSAMVPPSTGAVLPYGSGGYGMPPPPATGALVPAGAMPLAQPVPAPSLAAGLHNGSARLVTSGPLAPVSGASMGTPTYPGYNPSPNQSSS